MNIDAVMIHTTSQSHFEIAHYFLNIGIAVFVDKPAAMLYSEYESLHNIAEKKSTPLFIGF